MNDNACKVYGDAFFSLCCEENEGGLKDHLDEMTELNKVFSENPEFIKLMGAPTVPLEEKLAIVSEIVKSGKVSELMSNLMCVLTEKGRMSCFAGITKRFRELYNDKLKLAEITVTTSAPLSDEMKSKIAEKMSKVIGKTVTIVERVDAKIIGGVIIDYGSRRYDGSVKAKLNELSKELGSVIA